MQLGFVTAILPELSLGEIVDFAAETGYECIEVMCWPAGKADRRYAGITHIDMAKLDDKSAREIQTKCASKNVSISALGYYPNLLTPNVEEAKAARQQLEVNIRSAPLLGLNTVTTFVGRDWTRTIDDNWPQFLDVWGPLLKLAEQHGVRIAIENCPMSFTKDEWPGGKNLASSPAIWRRMYEALPSAAWGLNYDPSHMYLQHMDYLAPIKDFAERLYHVHAKDLHMDRAKLNEYGAFAFPNLYHRPKLPGLGDINWGQFFSALGDAKYRGPVCVEVEDRNYEHSLEARKAALVQSYRYLRNFVTKGQG
jgi:sugar phosphate isomerase/epimerase